MLHIAAEQEHYCLLTEGTDWTLAERRAGKYYPLGDCRRAGILLNQPDADRLLSEGRQYSEPAARRALTKVAADWRHLFEVIRWIEHDLYNFTKAGSGGFLRRGVGQGNRI